MELHVERVTGGLGELLHIGHVGVELLAVLAVGDELRAPQPLDPEGDYVTARSGADPSTPIEALRKKVIAGLKETYGSGVGAYPGALENWSFRPSSRAAAATASRTCATRTW